MQPFLLAYDIRLAHAICDPFYLFLLRQRTQASKWLRDYDIEINNRIYEFGKLAIFILWIWTVINITIVRGDGTIIIFFVRQRGTFFLCSFSIVFGPLYAFRMIISVDIHWVDICKISENNLIKF